MNNKIKLSIAQKLWLTVALSIAITIIINFSLVYVFYQTLYVDQIEKKLIMQGKKLASQYNNDESFRKNIQWYDQINDFQIVFFSEEQTYNDETDLSKEDIIKLVEGNQYTKIHVQTNKNIQSVYTPINQEEDFKGYIELSTPLLTIQDMSIKIVSFWFVALMLFAIIAVVSGTIWISRLTLPIKEMKKKTELLAKGDYSVRIDYKANDEMGSLASAFNHMATNIEDNDSRKKEFLSTVAHELRTPLSYIKGYSEAILDGLVKTKSERVGYLHLIAKESNRLQQLVQDLLSLAKLDIEPTKFIKQYPLAFGQFIEDFLEFFYPVAEEKKIELTADLDPEIIINGDEHRLGQVLQNLLYNAFLYTPVGGSVHVSLVKKGTNCILEVEDTGSGIPEEYLPYLTEPFYRVNKARSRADGGSGLGLAIVKRVVDALDGRLQIESKVNHGTSMKVILPLIKEEIIN